MQFVIGICVWYCLMFPLYLVDKLCRRLFTSEGE